MSEHTKDEDTMDLSGQIALSIIPPPHPICQDFQSTNIILTKIYNKNIDL